MKTLSTVSLSGLRASDIKIEDRGGNGVFVLFHTPYGRTFRKFGDIVTAERFALGERINFKIPAKSKKLAITETASKPAQFEDWTERMTSEEITTEPMVGYHLGFSGKEMANVETCFYGAWPNEKTQIPPGTIMVEIPTGTRIAWYDTEFRVTINSSMNAWKLKSGWLKSI